MSKSTPIPQAFHVMAKPTGARCNLECAYCFFLKKDQLYPGSSFHMTDEVMEKYIRQTIAAHQTQQVTIAWQGGEPTLMGLDFFRRAVDIEMDALRPGMTVENTLQTNGVLLDDEWCQFLHEKRFLVGLSLDGPREMHDAYRRDKAGQSVFDKVVAAVRLMQKHQVEFNILCTVNAVNSQHPLEVYKFFRDELGAQYIQFIPIVEKEEGRGTGAERGRNDQGSVGPLAARSPDGAQPEKPTPPCGHPSKEGIQAALSPTTEGTPEVQILTQEGIQAALNPTQEATQPAQIPSWDGSAPALSDAEGKRGVGSFLSPDDTQDQRKPDLGITDRSVQPEQYGRFLIEIFDEWVRRDVGKTYVLFFDGVLASYVNGRSSVCVLQPTCGEGVALEHNGDVYSCDHFVEPKHLLGNITTTPLGSLVSTVKQLRFGLAKSTGLPQTCRECRFLFTCHGECPKNRVLMTPDGEPGLNWLCAGLKAFFEHTEKPMKEMARLLKSGHYADEIMKPLREST